MKEREKKNFAFLNFEFNFIFFLFSFVTRRMYPHHWGGKISVFLDTLALYYHTTIKTSPYF